MLEADSPRTAAARCKELGNRCVAAKDSAGALRHYAEGLALLRDASGSSTADAPPLDQPSDLARLCGLKPSTVTALGDLSATLHANSAQVLIRDRRWLEAIEHCNAALRHNPSHTKAAWRGATAAIEVGMHDVAVSFVENGLGYNPECKELLELRQRLGPLPDQEWSPPGGDSEDIDIGALKAAQQRPWQPPAPQPKMKPGKEKGD
eukprot:gnl/TRDRNA2_/TRDRNA2_193778_c0_seq1.p1 gnl/TRDRNA2_/TRDRNA2_193778_c0~~gnl/TRDRNA2_/TRDRNA2_193778_c0_seq1.p1  ORF type:complete len:234 (+),score=56.58 gnl/TRDRNA2_/TRDRNA2_193778_c0_seq1:87-704(+)